MSQALRILVAMLLLASCRFSFDNPAERLVPGEIRGRTAQEKEGESGSYKALSDVRVRMRGLPFVLETRDTGFFAFLDLPSGKYDLLFDATAPDQHPRSAHRSVSLALGSDGQIEGVTLGDVPLLFTASVSGRVIDEETGLPIPFATVVDDLSLQTVTADADGIFTFPSLTIGEHTLRAAGAIVIDDDTSRPMVGGTLSVSLSREHERQSVQLNDPLPLRDATGRGRVQFEVGLMTPGSDPFGLDEIAVKATECEGTREITLMPPSSNGQVDDDQVPEGCWSIRLEPPEGPQSAEFTLRTEVDNVIVLADTEVELGKLLLVSAPSLFKSRNSCDVDADCGEGGVCEAGQCTGNPSSPADPCESDNGGCHENATCSSTEGGLVQCTCSDGFKGNGLSCVDIDECTEVNRETGRPLHGCGPNSICINEPGSYSCQCADGFMDVEGTCIDAARCDCGDNEICVEDSGSYACECAEGFRDEDGVCVDIDECAEVDRETEAPLHTCGPNSMCVNEPGSHSCECASGYVGIGDGDGFACVDIDECTDLDPETEAPLHDCGPTSVCVNDPGSYHCECADGYNGDGRNCTPTYVQLALGSQHSCGILANGELWCWGSNFSGALGTGDREPRQGPTVVLHPEGLAWKRVFAQFSGTCAIDADDLLWCWGDNSSGQLGLGTEHLGSPVAEPTLVLPEVRWASVALLGSQGCGVTLDNELLCWGYDAFSPTPLEQDETWSDPGHWIDVTGHRDTLCAVRHGPPPGASEGDPSAFSVWCWGDNSAFQFADGEEYFYKPSETTFFQGDHPPEFIVGNRQLCLIDPDDRSLWCRGSGREGLERVSDLRWSSLATANGTFCGIAESDELHCWGSDLSGKTGTGAAPMVEEVDDPTPVFGRLHAATVAVGEEHVCAVATDGELYCWGSNFYGQLAYANWPATETLLPVSPGTVWTHLSAGKEATCAIRNDSTLHCWGNSYRGRIANPDSGWIKSYSYPTPTATELDWQEISLRGMSGCGVDFDGRLLCWGVHRRFSLTCGHSEAPVLVSDEHSWSNVTMGVYFACATDDTGALWCGGRPPHTDPFIPGTGYSSFQTSPSRFGTLEEPMEFGWELMASGDPIPWSQVSGGERHACAIRGGALYCFGNNDHGQLGADPAEPHEDFVEIRLDEQVQPTWTVVSAGGNHTCAIDDQQRLWCWGNNEWGQLGTPPSGGQGPGQESSFKPVEVGNAGWASVSAGDIHTCAVRTDQTGWCWGSNAFGELGVGDFEAHEGPQQLEGTWLMLSAGSPEFDYFQSIPAAHTCGIRIDGSLWCWGDTSSGQSGNGLNESSIPRQSVKPPRDP